MAQIYRSTSSTATEGRGSLDAAWAIKHGIIGGLLAAVVFATLEMLGAWLMQGNATAPLHMIAGIPLQRPPDQIDDGTAIVAGTLAHLAYALVVSVIIALIVANVAGLRRSAGATILFSTVLNLLSFPLNFYVIAPLINAPWFSQVTDPTMVALQALYHAAFGAVLGWYLASKLPRVEVTPTPTMS